MKKPPIKIGTLAGAIHALKEGTGVGVFPTHCLAEELRGKELAEFKIKKVTASCPIFLSMKIVVKQTAIVDLVVDLLRRAKGEVLS